MEGKLKNSGAAIEKEVLREFRVIHVADVLDIYKIL